jgi:hypothetical protein
VALLTALKRHGSKNPAIPRDGHKELVHIISATSGFKNSIGVDGKAASRRMSRRDAMRHRVCIASVPTARSELDLLRCEAMGHRISQITVSGILPKLEHRTASQGTLV